MAVDADEELRLAREAYEHALLAWSEGAVQSPLWPLWDDQHRAYIFLAERRLRLAQEAAHDYEDFTTEDVEECGENPQDALDCPESPEEEIPRCTEPSGS